MKTESQKRMNLEEADDVVYTKGGDTSSGVMLYIKQALVAFLGLPLAIVLLFILLAAIVGWLDQSSFTWVQRLRQAISSILFKTADTSSGVMGLVATGLLTMTSLVISMLLLALQQTAGNMGNLVYDQFMKRRRNQLYVGYIVGTVILALLLRATPSAAFNPTLAATVSMMTAIGGIILLLYFLYSTMNQMRPQTIIEAIHDDALRARQDQVSFIQRTRRIPQHKAAHAVALCTEANGYITNIDPDRLSAAFAKTSSIVEVEAQVTLGAYVSYHDLLAWVKSDDREAAQLVATHLGDAYTIAAQRDGQKDPQYELEQLEMIAWTEMSTAKENPEAGILTIHAIRDLLARWLAEHPVNDEGGLAVTPLPFVYPDTIFPASLNTLESLALISSESKQHQGLSAILLSLALLLPHFSRDLQERSTELLVRILPTLDKHGLTRELDIALARLAAALEKAACDQAAQMVRNARQKQANKLPQPLAPPAFSTTLHGRPALPHAKTE